MWDSVSSTPFENSISAGSYFNAPNNVDSPAQAKGKKAERRVQNVVPVCIRQIRDHPEDDFSLFGRSAQIICVVGVLKQFDVQSTKATYEVEDHTGNIIAVWWLESDSDSEPNLPNVKEGRYVKVFGSLKNHDGVKTLMILRMFPIDNINEITTHLLEVIYTRLHAEATSKGEETKYKIGNPSSELSNSMTFMNNDVDMPMHVSGFTTLQTKVFNILKPVTTTQGTSRDSILKNFPPAQHRDVNEALEFLINEGHAYSTIDNDHFKVTDSF